jgi:hypothetical protein
MFLIVSRLLGQVAGDIWKHKFFPGGGMEDT